MQHYPVFLDLHGRPCVVIGGGPVAERKVEGLLEAGARVTVVSPTLTPGLTALAETHEVVHHPRPYQRGDLQGALLAVAATDDEDLHGAVAADAADAGVLLNVVDRPRLCSFIMPAVLRRGPVAVAVSTGGASPALAKRLRDELERAVGAEYGLIATVLGKLRERVAAAEPDEGTRARRFAALVDSPLLDKMKARDVAGVDAILERLVGAGTTLASLGVSLGAGGK